MKKYARIIDSKTKEVQVGVGTDAEYYASLGMAEQEVEEAYNGGWYLYGYAPKKSLDQMKEEKLTELKEARDKEEQTYLVWNGHKFDSDLVSVNRINLAADVAQDMPSDYTIVWTDYDNNHITMTKSDMKALKIAVVMHSSECHEKYNRLKLEVSNADSVEELEKIKWQN